MDQIVHIPCPHVYRVVHLVAEHSLQNLRARKPSAPYKISPLHCKLLIPKHKSYFNANRRTRRTILYFDWHPDS